MLKICAHKEPQKQGEISLLKLVGVKEFYNITRAKVVSAINCAIVVAVCATATFAVDTALDSTAVQAKPIETFPQSTENLVSADPTETQETTENTEESGEISETTVKVTVVSTPSATGETSATSETSESSETSATESTTQATQSNETITEKELYLVVYATTTINVRTGPGTDYDVVKSVFAGDQIDVVAITSNGWYKTYNGNYVKADLTTESEPTNTPKPTPKPTSNYVEETTKATEAPKPAPSSDGNTCTITFYGPQPNGDGTYNRSTASGTTCTEGRTCAADWSVYPKGTTIYIENDPLGGDGYYTVEDWGPGVNGYHIDIYAEDGETGNHSTCKRTVYVA